MLHVYELASVDCFGTNEFFKSSESFLDLQFAMIFVHESEEQLARFASEFVGFQCPHWKHSCLS